MAGGGIMSWLGHGVRTNLVCWNLPGRDSWLSCSVLRCGLHLEDGFVEARWYIPVRGGLQQAATCIGEDASLATTSPANHNAKSVFSHFHGDFNMLYQLVKIPFVVACEMRLKPTWCC